MKNGQYYKKEVDVRHLEPDFLRTDNTLLLLLTDKANNCYYHLRISKTQ